ncbi:flagellar hook capping FlgD N-terminal domain-containing protein [Saccharibacillus endophyticus]|uniref:Basal-body rod modification protein FlgD n=1 Tax=Saccharibacillus endophyticus TaxID=2060666 RepID=A0ABQ2A1M5_9BACL|nr:flagellar hook capping FlgD N-terminal domain-containing protein [Saccharibacillus endophyticus]GGH83964.1 hypothetical protein GCM10007362_37900 [Saccharibacillus endophyticus]
MANSNVSTTNIWPNYSTQNVQKAAAKKTDDAATMGKDQFMTILIAQLKNQDPLAPMDNSQFTAQMAQFSSLEQLMNMSTQLTQMNSSMGTASQLIGQKITWYDSETANYLTGNVASVLQKDGKMYAAVGEYLVPTSDITMVEPAGTSETPTSGTAPAAETPKSETNTDDTIQQAQTSVTPTSKSSTEEAAGASESGNDGGVK